jgi:hypothetical protein
MTQSVSTQTLTSDLKIGLISGMVSGAIAAVIAGICTYSVSSNTIKEERFLKATELIGHENPNVRSAGIIVMNQVMEDSPEKQWKIVEILTNLIAINSEDPKNKGKKTASSEVKIAINVIKKRDFSKDNRDGKQGREPRIINLADAFLVGTDFQYADLHNTSFNRSILSGVSFLAAELPDGHFIGTTFIGSELKGANLKNAKLTDANLENADLEGATLIGADFTEKQIKKACNWHLAIYDAEGLKKLGQLHKAGRETRHGCIK